MQIGSLTMLAEHILRHATSAEAGSAVAEASELTDAHSSSLYQRHVFRNAPVLYASASNLGRPPMATECHRWPPNATDGHQMPPKPLLCGLRYVSDFNPGAAGFGEMLLAATEGLRLTSTPPDAATRRAHADPATAQTVRPSQRLSMRPSFRPSSSRNSLALRDSSTSRHVLPSSSLPYPSPLLSLHQPLLPSSPPLGCPFSLYLGLPSPGLPHLTLPRPPLLPPDDQSTEAPTRGGECGGRQGGRRRGGIGGIGEYR